MLNGLQTCDLRAWIVQIAKLLALHSKLRRCKLLQACAETGSHRHHSVRMRLRRAESEPTRLGMWSPVCRAHYWHIDTTTSPRSLFTATRTLGHEVRDVILIGRAYKLCSSAHSLTIEQTVGHKAPVHSLRKMQRYNYSHFEYTVLTYTYTIECLMQTGFCTHERIDEHTIIISHACKFHDFISLLAGQGDNLYRWCECGLDLHKVCNLQTVANNCDVTVGK